METSFYIVFATLCRVPEKQGHKHFICYTISSNKCLNSDRTFMFLINFNVRFQHDSQKILGLLGISGALNYG